MVSHFKVICGRLFLYLRVRSARCTCYFTYGLFRTFYKPHIGGFRSILRDPPRKFRRPMPVSPSHERLVRVFAGVLAVVQHTRYMLCKRWRHDWESLGAIWSLFLEYSPFSLPPQDNRPPSPSWGRRWQGKPCLWKSMFCTPSPMYTILDKFICLVLNSTAHETQTVECILVYKVENYCTLIYKSILSVICK